MFPRLRPRLESLEGRMLLSTMNAPAWLSETAEPLSFVVPGTTVASNADPFTAFSGVVHALASQQAGSVTLTLQRLSSLDFTAPAIQVEVATGPITNSSSSVPSAAPGVQYQPVVETIAFPPGVRSEPVTIPIVAGAANPGLLSFEVTATQLGVTTYPDTADGGQATEDVFLAQNINAPVPRIDGAHMVLRGHRTSDFILHFNLPMDPASVQKINAYYLENSTDPFVVSIGGGDYTPYDYPVLKKATYNPSTNTVDLHLAKSVDARDGYRIMDSNVPLLDAAGTLINEDGSGLGGSFLITLTVKNTTIVDGVTQSVIPVTPPPR